MQRGDKNLQKKDSNIWHVTTENTNDKNILVLNDTSGNDNYTPSDTVDCKREEDTNNNDVFISAPPVKLCCPYVVELAVFFFSLVGSPLDALVAQYKYAAVAEHLGSNYTNLSTNNGPLVGCNGSATNGTHDYMWERREFVQHHVSQLNIYTSLASLLPMLVMTMFWGAYSDRMGRKLLMVLPTIAAVLACGFYLLIMKLNLNVYSLLVPPIIYDIVGPNELVIMAGFAYIADTCPPKNKAFRMALMDISLLVARAIGSIATGYFINALGFFWPFVFVVAGKLLVLVYVVTFVPQTKPKVSKVKKKISSYLSSTAKVYTKKTNNGRRWKLGLLTLSYLVVRLGETDAVVNLYIMNAPLCWGSVMIGYFNAYYTITIVLGLLFGTKILKRCISDAWLSASGLVSGLLGNCYVSVLRNTTMAMFVPPFLFLQLLPTPLIRAIMSNIVDPDEQGSMLAGITIAARLAGTFSALIVTPVYMATMKIWVGMVFLVSAGAYTIALIFMLLFIYLTGQSRCSGKNSKKDDEYTEFENVADI